MASRSPISRKDDSSKANLKSHVSVPKGFPAELLKPKTNQPIKSIHKVWNFVQLGKPTDSNNSKKGTSQPSIATIDAARDLAHQKNFTSLRTTATTSSVRDKTPPPNLGNSKSNPTFQSQARPSASEYSSVQPGNYRPSHDSQSQASLYAYHDRKGSEASKPLSRDQPLKSAHYQSTGHSHAYSVSEAQPERHTYSKHPSYASINPSHTGKEISPTFAKKINTSFSHSKSKSSITKSDTLSPEFNFESPLSSNRDTHGKFVKRADISTHLNRYSPISGDGARVERRLKYPPESSGQPQSLLWEPRSGNNEYENLNVSHEMGLNRSAVEDKRRKASQDFTSKNPAIKSLNLNKLQNYTGDQSAPESASHLRSYSTLLNNQTYQRDNVSTERYLYEGRQPQPQRSPPNGNQTEPTPTHLAADHIRALNYQQLIDEHKRAVTASFSVANASQKSSRSGNARTPEKQSGYSSQSSLATSFQNYLFNQRQSKANLHAKSNRSTHIDQPRSHLENNSSTHHENIISKSSGQLQRQQNASGSNSYNINRSFNDGGELADPVKDDYYETEKVFDSNRIKNINIHNYRATNESKAKNFFSDNSAGNPSVQQAKMRQATAESKYTAKTHRRNPVHQSMGQISQSFSQESRVSQGKVIPKSQHTVSSVNIHATTSDHSHSKMQSKILHNLIKDFVGDSNPSRSKQKQHISLSTAHGMYTNKRNTHSSIGFDDISSGNKGKGAYKEYSSQNSHRGFISGTEASNRKESGLRDLYDFRAHTADIDDYEYVDPEPIERQVLKVVPHEVSENYNYKNPLELSSLQNETISYLEDDVLLSPEVNRASFERPKYISQIAREEMDREKLALDRNNYIQSLRFEKSSSNHSDNSNLTPYLRGRSSENRDKSGSPIKNRESGDRRIDQLIQNRLSRDSDRKEYVQNSPGRGRRSLETNFEATKSFKLSFVTDFKGHRNTITSLARDPNKSAIFSGSLDGTILAWNASDMKKAQDSSYDVRDLKGVTSYKKPINSLIYQPLSRTLVSGSSDSTIRVWNGQSYECMKILRGHGGGVFSLLAVDSQKVLSGSGDQQIKLWDLEKGCELNSFFEHANRVTSLCRISNHDNYMFLSGSIDSKLKIWDTRINDSIATFSEHEGPVNVTINIEDNLVASAGQDGQLYIWDMLHRRVKDQFDLGSEIHSLAYYKTAEKVLVGTDKLSVVDLYDEKKIEVIDDPNGHTGSIKSLLIDNTLDLVYSGSFDTNLKVWLLKRNVFN